MSPKLRRSVRKSRTLLVQQGKFLTWRFAQEGRDWIVACRDVCQAPRVRQFLDEFLRFITSEFGESTDPQTAMEHKHVRPELERLLSRDPDNIRSAAAIAELFPIVRQGWVDDVFKAVQKRLHSKVGKDWLFEQTEGHFIDEDWASMKMWHPSWGDVYRICLESQPRYGYVVLGIWRDKTHGRTREMELHQQLKRLGWGEKPGGPYWEAHSPLPEPFRNWASTQGTVALRTQRNELIDLLTSEFTRLATAFQKPLADRIRKK